jgi:hypothetical protein
LVRCTCPSLTIRAFTAPQLALGLSDKTARQTAGPHTASLSGLPHSYSSEKSLTLCNNPGSLASFMRWSPSAGGLRRREVRP